MTNIRNENLLVDGIKTHLKVGGEGFPILILHGWGASSESWEKIQSNLIKKGFKVYCPDLPGFGKSQDLFESWDLDDYYKWVMQFCNEFDLKEMNIIAHSFGGRITIKLNQNHFEEKINKNILIAPAGVKVELNKRQKILSLIVNIGNFIFSLPLLKFLKEKAKKIFYLLLPKMDYTKANPIMQETMQKVIEEDLTPLLPNIKKETILIWGEKDKMVPLEISKIFENNITDSKVIVIPKIGHSPHLDNPSRLTKIIIKFL